MNTLLLSIPEAAKSLSIGRSTVYLLIADGKLDTLNIGRRRLIKADSIRRLIGHDTNT